VLTVRTNYLSINYIFYRNCEKYIIIINNYYLTFSVLTPVISMVQNPHKKVKKILKISINKYECKS
jgi:hypothetical protein